MKGRLKTMTRKHYKLNKIIYCDMDGVLADFMSEPDGINRFENEEGFFLNLKPFAKNVKAIKQLIADGNKVYILSISPNERADGEKRAWLKKHIPTMRKKNIIILRKGANKNTYASADGVLLDDYGKNIKDWVSADGIGWKIRADGDIAIAIETVEVL